MVAKFHLINVTANPKAILILVPGSNYDGRIMGHDIVWMRFAWANKLSIVGCYFMDEDHTRIEGYADAIESGRALFNFLLSNKLSECPLLLWGFSAGGQFNYELAKTGPLWGLYIAAFVVNKGGIYYTLFQSEYARRTPGLFFLGTKDDEFRPNIIRTIYNYNKLLDPKCNWQLVEENTGHEEGESVKLSQEFFEEVLKGLGK